MSNDIFSNDNKLPDEKKEDDISKEKINISEKDVKILKENPDIEKFVPTFEGPFEQKMKVLKEGDYRLDGKLYHLRSGEFFDGVFLNPKKIEILINTKFIVKC